MDPDRMSSRKQLMLQLQLSLYALKSHACSCFRTAVLSAESVLAEAPPADTVDTSGAVSLVIS